MDRTAPLTQLHRHQQDALALLAEALDAVERGRESRPAARQDLRGRLATVLGAYQRFKHHGIFDPALASGDAEGMALGRAMKVECIAADEVFRAHVRQWSDDAIAADWPSYKVAARLGISSLRRHIATESDGIEQLILRYADA